MRDHLAHRYFDTDHSVLQATVSKDLPELERYSGADGSLAGREPARRRSAKEIADGVTAPVLLTTERACLIAPGPRARHSPGNDGIVRAAESQILWGRDLGTERPMAMLNWGFRLGNTG